MILRSTTPISGSFAAKAAAVACAILMAISLPISMAHNAFATNYDAQIQAAQREADKNNSVAQGIGLMADSYQAELDALEAQKNAIQNQIVQSQERRDGFVRDIKVSEEKIEENKSALGDTIADMYVDSDTSTLEMIASSKTIGDFVDKQAQQSSIRDKLVDTIDKIDALKKQLEGQKKSVEQEIEVQKVQRKQLADKEAEKAELVAETRGQENEYRKRASANNAEVNRLHAAQAEENRRAMEAAAAASGGSWGGVPAGTPGGGGYPGYWASAPLDAYVDPWGLYTRECVSYVAWKVASTKDPSGWQSNPYKYVPHFRGAGNANQWPSTLSNKQQGYTPRQGAAAVSMAGTYGHVMYVESVLSNGNIIVSDYNFAWDGLYRTYERSPGGLTYIYF